MAKRTTKPAIPKQPTVGAVGHEAVMPLQRAEDGTLGAVITEFSGGLPSVVAPDTAEPGPTSVMEGAPSSSAEAANAPAQATETGEAAGKAATGDLPATDTSIGEAQSQPEPPPATDTASQATGAGVARKRISDAFDGLTPKTIRITSRIEGFRRAGMRHSKAPVEHPIDRFSDEQLALLEKEPNLTVEYL
ncbi:hypothetical protein CXZ10_05860 [Pleomorphomonas diazotrophica]|uniref:Mu-like prophage FluMu N-terminal domain-containing protein n=1 Tax=Pleomorphomonas diazotrophica TaxID=1166257 RepID=A0A1I4Q7U5_9HYPH|nr:HI1506-related protein [Pleomorphomonas diazotrophica]PKR90874.1 hypothetical protein CXZ10_05860 [Pleomorphomonas diazotrophica]SFM36152.1 hypothetical protein SAMN05192571_101139 [Pleomorphomonas diazotrophica]